jgi:hypothetical protein
LGKELIERMAARQFVRAVGGEDEQRQCRHRARQKAQQIEARRVRPVQIVEEERDGLRLAQGHEEVLDLHEERHLGGYRADGAPPGERVGQHGSGRGRREAGEEVDPRAVRRGLGEVEAMPLQHRHSGPLRFPHRCFGEGGLADTRLAADQHEAALPRHGGVEMLAQDTEFTVASDQCGRGTRRWGGVHAVPRAVHGARSMHSGQGMGAK